MPLIQWTDTSSGGTPLSAARLNAMRDNVLSATLANVGSQGSPATAGALTLTPSFVVSGVQRVALTQTVYAGGNTALLAPSNVLAGMEAWLTIHFRHVGGPWTFTPFGWTPKTEGAVGIAASTTADAYDIFEFYTPDGGTTWLASVSKGWA